MPGDDFAAFRAIEIQAIVCVALLKEGRLAAMMAVHQTEPRHWNAEEIHLVEMVAERSWAIIERAFADRRAKERADEIEALNSRLRLAMKETHHRVKNNLQVISAMIEMQLMEHQDGQSVPAGRIHASAGRTSKRSPSPTTFSRQATKRRRRTSASPRGPFSTNFCPCCSRRRGNKRCATRWRTWN